MYNLYAFVVIYYVYPRTVVRNGKNLNHSRCRVPVRLASRTRTAFGCGGLRFKYIISPLDNPISYGTLPFSHLLRPSIAFLLGPCHLPCSKICGRPLIGLSIAKGRG